MMEHGKCNPLSEVRYTELEKEYCFHITKHSQKIFLTFISVLLCHLGQVMHGNTPVGNVQR